MSSRKTFRFLLVGLATLVTARWMHAAATDAPMPTVAAEASPALVTGTLPNGVRYYILPHVSPRNDLSLRLVVRAGSLDERDDERGFAHFVEHLAFRGTRTHPAGGIRQTFEKLGLAFGADLNARTRSTDTIYLMDLPDGRAGGLAEALGLLREFADGISFVPDQVARERGVVLSELRVRDNPTHRVTRAVEEALYAGTRIPSRNVSGLPEQIKHATAEPLRVYYERNYTPDRMALVVVGAIEPSAVVAMLAEAFGSLRAPSSAGPAAAEPAADPALTIRPQVIVVPNSPGVIVDVVRIHSRPRDELADRRNEQLHAIALRAIEARLRARQDLMSPSLGSTSVREEPGATPSLRHDTITITSTYSRWAESVAFIETELRRIRLHGFTAAEVAEAIAVIRAERRAALSQLAGAPASLVAEELTLALQSHERWFSPAEELEAFDRLGKNVDAKAIANAASEAFPDNSFHLVIRTPQAIPGGNSAVLAAFAKSATLPLANDSAEAAELTFAYPPSGSPGLIRFRDHDPELAIERVTFANGVQLNVRPSSLEPERFRLRVSFAENASAVPPKRPGMVEVAGMVYLGANLGRHVEAEIRRLLALHGVSRHLEVSRGVLTISLVGQTSELPFTLALVAAATSDLRPDPVVYPVAFSRYNHFFTAQLNDLSQQAMWESQYRAAGKDSRLQLPPAAQVARYTFAEVMQWMTTYLANGPLEIGIVGDVDVEKTIAAAATTIGVLPARVSPVPGKPLMKTRRGSERDLTSRTVAGAASAALFWPLTIPDDPRHNAAAAVAMNVLSDRLRATLRDQLGATYTPTTGIRRDRRQPDFGFAWVATTFAPARATTLTQRTLDIARRLAKEGVTPEEFVRLRAPIRARYHADLRNNAWWLDSVVALAQTRPETLAEARAHETVVDQLTIEEVNDAARLFAAPATVTIVRPAGAP